MGLQLEYFYKNGNMKRSSSLCYSYSPFLLFFYFLYSFNFYFFVLISFHSFNQATIIGKKTW